MGSAATRGEKQNGEMHRFHLPWLRRSAAGHWCWNRQVVWPASLHPRKILPRLSAIMPPLTTGGWNASFEKSKRSHALLRGRPMTKLEWGKLQGTRKSRNWIRNLSLLGKSIPHSDGVDRSIICLVLFHCGLVGSTMVNGKPKLPPTECWSTPGSITSGAVCEHSSNQGQHCPDCSCAVSTHPEHSPQPSLESQFTSITLAPPAVTARVFTTPRFPCLPLTISTILPSRMTREIHSGSSRRWWRRRGPLHSPVIPG